MKARVNIVLLLVLAACSRPESNLSLSITRMEIVPIEDALYVDCDVVNKNSKTVRYVVAECSYTDKYDNRRFYKSFKLTDALADGFVHGSKIKFNLTGVNDQIEDFNDFETRDDGDALLLDNFKIKIIEVKFSE